MYWSLPRRIAFRFFFIYFIIYALSNQSIISYLVDNLWRAIVPWFAEHILGLPPVTTFSNGSGDTTYNYVSVFMYVLFALLGTGIWSVLDKKREAYPKLYFWLIVGLRYYVAYQMIIYGMAKVMYLQFRPPNHSVLMQSYGESSPMGLLWTFMGYSLAYNYFTGFAELLGGFLLLYRRAVTLGALVTVGVMSNVMALNYFYDVPVKLLSTHLVLFSTFLILMDSRRLWNFFIVNAPTEPVLVEPYLEHPNDERIRIIAKWSILGICFLGFTGFMIFFKSQNGPQTMDSPLAGVYDIESIRKNGKEVPPLLTDTTYWRRVIIDYKNYALIQHIHDVKVRYAMKVSTEEKTITLRPETDKEAKGNFTYSYPDSTHLLFEGVYQKDTLHILMRIRKKEDFLLYKRGFHWINETPFYR